MDPLITNGQRVKLKKMKWDDLEIGDIVYVQVEDIEFLHRLIFKSRNYGVTWGENNNCFDGKIHKERFYGKLERAVWKHQALFYMYEWKLLRKCLTKQGIEWVVLKGPIWQKKYFGYIFNRPFSDLDLLINRKDYLQVKKVLVSNGWRQVVDNGVDSRKVRNKNPKTGEVSFIKKLNNNLKLKVDLHLEAVSWSHGEFFDWPFNQESAGELSRYLVRQGLGGVLKPTDWLFYACLHYFLNHNCRGVWQIADIANVIETKDIKWERFWSLSETYYCGSITKLVIYWARRMFYFKNKFQAPGGKIGKLLINERNIFNPIHPIMERDKNDRLNAVLRFWFWPDGEGRKVRILVRFFLSKKFWSKLFTYLLVLPSLLVLIWKAYQWLGVRLGQFLSLPKKIFQKEV